MKRLIAAALIALPCFAHAEELALNFTAIPLVQFAQTTYRAMLKRDFVMSPELLSMDRPITISVRKIQSEDLPVFVERILSSHGVKSELRDGVYFLSSAACSDGTCAGGDGRSAISLTGPVNTARLAGSSLPVGGAVARPELGIGDVGSAHGADGPDVERDVYRPRNRKSDFLAAVLNAAFKTSPATSSAGVVVLAGTKSQLEKIMKLAQQLDEAAPKVKLSATFVEVSTNESSGLGVSIIADVLGARLGVKLGDSSTGSLSLKTNSFQAVIDALAADGRFKQVAAPTALVDDYEKSSLSFGDSVPTIGSTALDRNGTAVQQVQYQQSGVLLNVQPSVLGSGRINVVVDGQVSTFSATTTGVSGSPTLSKRQVQTSVTMDDGELLMIGGLNNNKTVNNTSGFSFLPKSWAVGSKSTANTDLVLILTASVVK